MKGLLTSDVARLGLSLPRLREARMRRLLGSRCKLFEQGSRRSRGAQPWEEALPICKPQRPPESACTSTCCMAKTSLRPRWWRTCWTCAVCRTTRIQWTTLVPIPHTGHTVSTPTEITFGFDDDGLLATARLLLDNVCHIQVPWLPFGLKAAHRAGFGGDDVGPWSRPGRHGGGPRGDLPGAARGGDTDGHPGSRAAACAMEGTRIAVPQRAGAPLQSNPGGIENRVAFSIGPHRVYQRPPRVPLPGYGVAEAGGRSAFPAGRAYPPPERSQRHVAAGDAGPVTVSPHRTGQPSGNAIVSCPDSPCTALRSSGEHLLVSKVPIDELDDVTIACTVASATSARVLLNVVLTQSIGVQADYCNLPSNIEDPLEDNEAALLNRQCRPQV